MESQSKFLETALQERGAAGGKKYVAWYNSTTGSNLALNVAWCAIFVSWCARQSGVGTKEIPNFAGCTTGRGLFRKMGIWKEKAGYTPRPGDLVLFDWNGDPTFSEHVGIVKSADAKLLYTVEGNSGSTVREKTYARNSGSILGYAAWSRTADTIPVASPVELVQSGLNSRYQLGLLVDGSWGPVSKKAMVTGVQRELNTMGKQLTVDGIFSPSVQAALPVMQAVTVNGLAWCIQGCLAVRGYNILLDGSYGPATQRAVSAFQGAMGLTANGICDQITVTRLLG